jgi:predicted transcriptional regulator
MSKTVTLRLDDEIYRTIKTLAEQENRNLSNFIETATLRYISEIEFVDEFEQREIESNDDLKKAITKGVADYKAGRGEFV